MKNPSPSLVAPSADSADHSLSTIKEAAGQNSYFLNRNRGLQVRCSLQKDILDGQYTVATHSPLPHLDSPIAKAYDASARKSSSGDDSTPLYALVLNKRLPSRLHIMNRLRGQEIPNFCNIRAAEILPLSSLTGRQSVVVLQRPKGISLREYVTQKGPIKEDLIRRKLIPAAVVVLRTLETLGISHGRLNLDTLFVDEQFNFTIGECISEMPGLSQPLLYETLDRSVIAPMGKGAPEPFSDYYALGVTVLLALTGNKAEHNMLHNANDEDILHRKFAVGSYTALVEGHRFSTHMHDFFRGVLNDKKKDAWGAETIEEWAHGKAFNLLPPTIPTDAVRPIHFNGRDYMNRKLLAHDLGTHWQDAKKFVQTDALARWAQRGLRDEDLADHFEYIQNHTRKTANSPTFDSDDDRLIQVIFMLDPEGPLRMRGFSSHLDGIGPMLAYAFLQDKQVYIHAIRDLMAYGVVKEWERLSPRISKREVQLELFALQRASELFPKSGMGFGMERCLYELNPTLCCQSPALYEEYILNSAELLLTYDSNTKIIPETILDTHIATFLANRVELLTPLRLKGLASFPNFSQHWGIQAVTLLHLAQQRGGAKQLPRLCEKLIAILEPVIELLHSRTLRKNVQEKLASDAKRGNITAMLSSLIDPENLIRDHVGFKRATREYTGLSRSIDRLLDRRTITNAGYRQGLQLCVVFSFLLAAIVIIVLIIKAF